MKNKVCFITGATSGIGLATAKGLAEKGTTLVLLVRDAEKGEKVVNQIKSETKNTEVDFIVGDLASLDSVRKAAETFKNKYDYLNILINNAGAFFPKREETIDSIEKTFQINYLSHFLLTQLLLAPLKNSGNGRIINVAAPSNSLSINFDDILFYKGYSLKKALGQSKLAMVMFTKALAEKLKGEHITVNALNPGLVKTNILNKHSWFGRNIIRLLARSPEIGAETSIYLACSPELNGVSGKFYTNCEEQHLQGMAKNDELIIKLWEISLELTSKKEVYA